uniref:NADH-ubiquinone oxidoreductase chain 3 n=1 Tax=Siphonosoma cumanense TaxID=6444 RepID=A0A7D4VF59_SIPCU|nr:NADH dehydrogenase subunit 3 [Siphonosoma cumanense]QKS32598.1 NADH dehydrogenase subunit 3 [Siphonosoma cumanense]
MLLTLLTLALSTLLAALILTVTKLISFRSFADREKLSPFECGFDPKSSARLPFSLRFFLLAVIFLVFDIEIALLLPLPLAMTSFSTTLLGSSLAFILVLILGVLHEWNQGSLNW